MAGIDASEGQALWQPGGGEEDSRLHDGNRHLHLAYDEEEEEDKNKNLYVTGVTWPGKSPTGKAGFDIGPATLKIDVLPLSNRGSEAGQETLDTVTWGQMHWGWAMSGGSLTD